MNEAILGPIAGKAAVTGAFRKIVWNAARSAGLHGLYTGPLEDQWFMLTRREISLPGLGMGLDGAKIAHLTDLHFSMLMRQGHLRNFVELTNRLEPDFIVLTGDFITSASRYYARLAGRVLSGLRPRYAALAVLGNHDYGIWHPRYQSGSADLAEYLTGHLQEGGIHVLSNESHAFRRDGATLHLVGLADLWSPIYDPARAFAHVPPGAACVALVHNPDAAMDLARRGARYVLSGHTHGRPTPRTLLNELLFPVVRRDLVGGQYSLGGGRFVYVNRGLGHSRRPEPDARPEIALFTLRHSQPACPAAPRPRRTIRLEALSR